MTMHRILITGGAGYIGTALAHNFLSQGYQVSIFDNFSTGQREKIPQGAQVIVGDVTKRAEISEAMKQSAPTQVIHLAALKMVGESEEDPGKYYRVNVLGTLNVLEAMKEQKISSIIFSSTAAVYQPTSQGVYQETNALEANSVYGSTKIICEELIKQYARLGYIQSYTIFRYFNVAGDVGISYLDTQAQNVFPLLAQAITRGSEFAIFGDDYNTQDGTAVRDYIHLADLVSAHKSVLGLSHQEVFNLGTNIGTSVRMLVDAFEKVAGKPLVQKIEVRRPGDAECAIALCDKAYSYLSWKPQKTLEDMISSTLEVYE
ncbi:MAG: UDP-glucose 4-epimerase GalE [Patescibacteria group bacterium]